MVCVSTLKATTKKKQRIDTKIENMGKIIIYVIVIFLHFWSINIIFADYIFVFYLLKPIQSNTLFILCNQNKNGSNIKHETKSINM